MTVTPLLHTTPSVIDYFPITAYLIPVCFIPYVMQMDFFLSIVGIYLSVYSVNLLLLLEKKIYTPSYTSISFVLRHYRPHT